MSRIDVVIPCYNYGGYLRQCVDSVTAQSHRDLRVLIVDDCSTDETPNVSAELAARDDRIEVRRHPTNRGHIDTYNEGIEWLGGDYWLLLSADDFLMPGALGRAVGALDADRQIGLVHGAFAPLRAGQMMPFHVWRPGASFRAEATSPGGTSTLAVWDPADLIASLAVGNHIGVMTAIARVDVQRRVGLYRRDLKHAGDLEMWLRFALVGRVGCIDAYQAVQRRHDRNMSSGYAGYPDFRQRVRSFDLHIDEIRALGPRGPELVRNIRKRQTREAWRWARRALRQRHFDQLWELCGFAFRTKPFGERDLTNVHRSSEV